MRTLLRNKRKFHYCPFIENQPIIDDDGNEIGTCAAYGDAVPTSGRISPASGNSAVEAFGTIEPYSRVLIMHGSDCPISENTVLFVDKLPEYNDEGMPLHDYIVTRVSRSYTGNTAKYLIKKVFVS